MPELYVLEYNKEQDAYHIQSMSERDSRTTLLNLDWVIIGSGTQKQMNTAFNRRHKSGKAN